jgi:hypothetical protein
MKHGNWVPISKNLVKYLPKDRAFTRVEAAYSIQIDYNKENRVTVAAYAAQWKWSKDKVYRFFKKMRVSIKYDESTKQKQNQRGVLMPKKPTDNKSDIRLITTEKPTDESKEYQRLAETGRLISPKKPTDNKSLL